MKSGGPALTVSNEVRSQSEPKGEMDLLRTRLLLLSLVVFVAGGAWANSKSVVTHVVTQDETGWFLATVYYGRGQDFHQILQANHLKDPKEIHKGMELKIPNAKYYRGQEGFAARYADAWKKRALALKKLNRDVSPEQYLSETPIPHSLVVIPTEQILKSDSVKELPMTEITGPRTSGANLPTE